MNKERRRRAGRTAAVTYQNGGHNVAVHSSPTYPRTSTFENATVGVGGAPSPMNERVRPFDWNVDTRGVDKLGNATGPAWCDINVIADGVRVVRVGDGGNTNSVWDGVCATAPRSADPADALRSTLLRRCRGGGTSLRDSTRLRTGGSTSGVAVESRTADREGAADGLSASITSVMGDDGTGGRMLRFVGRSLDLAVGRGGSWKVDRTAVAGGGGIENEVFHTGAEGRGLAVARLGDVTMSMDLFRGVPSCSSSGEDVVELSSVRLWRLSVSNPRLMPKRSCSSSSSTRSSLIKLLFVLLLATEPVRLR